MTAIDESLVPALEASIALVRERDLYKQQRDELAIALADLLKRIDTYFGRDPQSDWKEEKSARLALSRVSK